MATTFYNRGHFYAPHVTPVLLDMHFQVQSADTGGFGITGLKGPGIKNVFMHTSATPGTNNGMTNPNPAAGYILVQLKDSYTRLFAASANFVSPNSGSNLLVASAGLTIGQVYVISVLGTTTQAQWQILGVPPGATASVGMAFVALATSCTGTGAVQLPAAAGSGIDHVEIVGLPDKSIASQPFQGSLGVSPWILLQCLGTSITMASYTPAGTITNGTPDTFAGTPAVLTGTSSNSLATPANGTFIHLELYLSQSTVTTTGE